MKKQLFSFILAGFLLLAVTGIGQNKNYPITKINGVDYYQYKVEVSEGLFAIGRKFETSPDDITKANPEIKNGLKAGQLILIPVPPKAESRKAIENTSKLQFIEHKVEKNQTLFAVSKKYNVSQEDILKYNSDIQQGLREGLVLRIPIEAKKNAKKEEVKPTPENKQSEIPKKDIEKKQNIVTHVVKQNETLYSISKRYNVEVADIIANNPASASTLSVGTELKIPVKSDVISANETRNVAVTVSNSIVDVNSFINPSELSSIKNKNKVIRIAFLLPFMLDQDKKDAGNEKFVDFYSGALIAIKEAQVRGTSFEIYTYDTEKSEEKLQEVLSNSEIKTMDLIVGPVFSNQVVLIGEFAKENRINTLIPFSSKVPDIDSNPYLFQFNPGTDTELDYAAELLTKKLKDVQIVFAEVQGISSMDEGKNWSEALQSRLRKADRDFKTLYLYADQNDFGSVLASSGKNLIIFNTDKYAYVSPFISTLKTIENDYNIILFEQYGWRNQDAKLKQNMYLSPFITGMNPLKLTEFNRQFTFYLGKKPSADLPRYDLLGYDLTNYFVSLFKKYGNKLGNKIGSFNFTNGIQSQPRFENISTGSGFVNQHVYMGEN